MRLAVGVLVAVGALIAAGCADPVAVEPSLGPACAALRRAATRSAACDPQLHELLARLVAEPIEVECIVAVRAAIGTHVPEPPRLRSVYEGEPPRDLSPLSERELAALESLQSPASLVVTPDVGRVPGIPPTSASIEGLGLDVDADGRLTASVEPGAHTLRLRHAGRESHWCVELQACQVVEVTAHASQLATHPGVRAGACGEVSSTVP